MKRASDSLRKSWVIQLNRMISPETGEVLDSAFRDQQRLYEKGCRAKALNSRIRNCGACTLAGHNLIYPLPGWGNLNARYMFVGQSLHEPGIQSDIPFILGSGLLIDASLRLVHLRRRDVFLTNAVHCHPVRNRPSKQSEIDNCRPYLVAEIDIVQPEMILALGNDAKASVAQIAEDGGIPEDTIVVNLTHPAAVLRSSPEAPRDWVIRVAREMSRI